MAWGPGGQGLVCSVAEVAPEAHIRTLKSLFPFLVSFVNHLDDKLQVCARVWGGHK